MHRLQTLDNEFNVNKRKLLKKIALMIRDVHTNKQEDFPSCIILKRLVNIQAKCFLSLYSLMLFFLLNLLVCMCCVCFDS